MAKRVLSIEIGQQVTKAVVVDYLRKNPHVYNAFSFDTPEGALEDGYVRDKEKIATLIRTAMKDNAVKEKAVVFSIASGKIASREVTVPYVADNKLDDLVKATASDYFPINMDEYTLAYNVLETVNEGDKKSLKLLLLAAPDTLVENYYALADELNVDIEALDYYGNGSMQVLQKHIGSGYNVCVQIGSLNTMVSVLNQGQQIMQRTIPYGTNSILDAMLEQPTLEVRDRTEAMELICRENIIYATLDYEDAESFRGGRVTEDQFRRSTASVEARQAITDSVGGILLSVIRVIDYFNSRYPDSQLMSVYITGMGVKIRGIDVLFEKEMDIPVRKLEKLTNITFARGFVKTSLDQTEFIACIGAAIEPVNFKPKSIAAKASRKESMRVVHAIFGAAVALSAVLCLVGFVRLNKAKTENENLHAEKEKLSYINQIYQENEQAINKYNEVKSLDESTTNYNEQLLTLLEDLEKNLPKEMRVSQFNSDGASINMSITTKRKISVAAMLVNFEGIDYLTNVSVPAISYGESDDKKIEYTFSVTASFTKPAEEAEGDAESTDSSSTETTTQK